jgi:hypothetical protein
MSTSPLWGSKFRHMVKVFLKGTVLKDTVEYIRGSEHNFASEELVVKKLGAGLELAKSQLGR